MRAPCRLALAVATGLGSCEAQDLKPIAPLRPRARNLSLETLPNVLWVPSASTHVWSADGPFRHECKGNGNPRGPLRRRLPLRGWVSLIESGVPCELRAKTGVQPYVADGALNTESSAGFASGQGLQRPGCVPVMRVERAGDGSAIRPTVTRRSRISNVRRRPPPRRGSKCLHATSLREHFVLA
jgi:hypothetical protein